MSIKKWKNALPIFFLFLTIMILLYVSLFSVKEGLTDINFAKDFCVTHQSSGKNLNESCQTLTKSNCTSTSCCVWASDKKCYAGDSGGLLFPNETSKKEDFYYYYQDTCYGKSCPSKTG